MIGDALISILMATFVGMIVLWVAVTIVEDIVRHQYASATWGAIYLAFIVVSVGVIIVTVYP
jgi:hypothetical protein